MTPPAAGRPDPIRAKPWREIACDRLLDCRIFEVERSLALSPEDGSEHPFVRLRSADWVQIVPVTRAHEIVMVRQYRHGSGSIVLEIPGGLVDRGEDPAAAAVRECLEETGYLAGSVHSMGSMNPNPALFSNRLHSFYARGVERIADVQNTGTELTEVVLVPVRELRGLLRDNRIDHTLVAATLWRYLCESL
jgi:8-oxo-dGTP pyrophosphatase MutT (NUDIX family)